jgi:hypothetical protein
MTRSHRTLGVALSKVAHYRERTYCGYLLPVEVLALAEVGAGITREDRERCTLCKAQGQANPRWVYFTLPKALEQEIKP